MPKKKRGSKGAGHYFPIYKNTETGRKVGVSVGALLVRQ